MFSVVVVPACPDVLLLWLKTTTCLQVFKCRFNHSSFLISQHRGFCVGSHMAHEDQFDIRLPVGKKDSLFQYHNPVEVKCEIYEPQVPA